MLTMNRESPIASKTTEKLPADYAVCPVHNEPYACGVCQYCRQEENRYRATGGPEADYEGWHVDTLENVDDMDNLYDDPSFP